MKTFYLAIAAAALTSFAAPAVAATFTTDGTCNAELNIDPDADLCWGRADFFDGGNGGINDSEDLLNNNVFLFDPTDEPGSTTEGLFNYDDWQFAERINIGDDGDATSEEIDVGLGVNVGDGTWSATAELLADYEDFLIVLKAGPTFAAYLYNSIDELVDDIAGTFNTDAFPNPTGNSSQGLSHITAYVRGEGDGGGDDPNGEIPLPAAGWMLLAGVGGLAAMRRRKKA